MYVLRSRKRNPGPVVLEADLGVDMAAFCFFFLFI